MCDTIVHDELVHNSLHMGMRLWKSESSSRKNRVGIAFRHNCPQDLELRLQHLLRRPVDPSGEQQASPSIVVLIESVYSMDGDVAPVKCMLDICARHGALMVVDEAHGLGVFGAEGPGIEFYGTGVLAQAGVENHPALLCSVHTFGKAAGCHGAVICGSKTLKLFLVNYGYPVIYSTALPLHSLIAIQCAYVTMTSLTGECLRNDLFRLVRQFRDSLIRRIGLVEAGASAQPANRRIYLLPSCSPIQALMIPGNHRCTEFCRLIFLRSKERICLYPIKTPTVPSGQERIRIILHAHNTLAEVEKLVSLIHDTLQIMGLIPGQNDSASLRATTRSKL
jgi:8-amino-7-oxononanoate synthase